MKNRTAAAVSGLNLEQFLTQFEELTEQEKTNILLTLKASMQQKKRAIPTPIKSLRKHWVAESPASIVFI